MPALPLPVSPSLAPSRPTAPLPVDPPPSGPTRPPAPRHRLRVPRGMRVAPALDSHPRTGPVKPRYALLINPFYPKDPHASFGKHVLTPSLALTSVAGATPA